MEEVSLTGLRRRGVLVLSPVSCQALSTQAGFASTVSQDPSTGTSGLPGASEEGSSGTGGSPCWVADSCGWQPALLGFPTVSLGVPAAGAAPGECSAFQHSCPEQGLGGTERIFSAGQRREGSRYRSWRETDALRLQHGVSGQRSSR